MIDGPVPQGQPRLRIERFRPAVDAAMARVVSSDSYILGPEVAEFEKAFAAYLGAEFCIGVNSGTDALTIALRSLDLPAGAEVLTVSMTASATGLSIMLAGLTPRFVDVDRVTRCIDIDCLESGITSRTAAIVPVHLHGNPADMPRLMEIAGRFGLPVVEDCAQAHGARLDGRAVGSFGHAAAFSFYPTKNLGGIGDGGAVVTNLPDVAERAKALRSYGWGRRRGTSDALGYNSRLSEIQAAILSALLPKLDEGNRERAAIADRYRDGLASLVAANRVVLPRVRGSVYHQFAIEVGDRDVVMERLAAAGVGTATHYAVPLHRQPAFAHCLTTELPVTDRLASRLLSLPIQPEVAEPRLPAVVERIADVIASLPRPATEGAGSAEVA